jgi:hypothetical protein
MDGKNLELRIPAYRAQEQAMIALFEKPDEAPFYGSNHLLNFSIVYPELWAEETRAVGLEKVGPWVKEKYESSWYQWCKNGGFCKQYGGQKPKTDATFHRVGAYDLLESRFAGLAKWNAECVAHAHQHGYVETLPDRTVDPVRGYPLLCAGGKRYGGNVSPTIPMNYVVQGTACWWIARGMVRCYEMLQEYNHGKPASQRVHMILQVHDELVFDFPKSVVDPVKATPGTLGYTKTNLPTVAKLNQLMAQGGEDIGIPTPVSCKYHPSNWAEGLSVAL